MSTAVELLEQIAQRLDSLPDRLGSVIQSSDDGGSGRARSSAPTDISDGKGRSVSGGIGHKNDTETVHERSSNGWGGWQWSGKEQKKLQKPIDFMDSKNQVSSKDLFSQYKEETPSYMNPKGLAKSDSLLKEFMGSDRKSGSGGAASSGSSAVVGVLKEILAVLKSGGRRDVQAGGQTRAWQANFTAEAQNRVAASPSITVSQRPATGARGRSAQEGK